MSSKKFLIEHEEIKNYLINKLNETPEYENIKNIIKLIVFDERLKNCKFCGKLLKYSKMRSLYCCKKCANLDPEIIEKNRRNRENTNLLKYGVKSIFERENFQQEYKNNSLNKYGVDHPAKLKIQKEKTKQTCLEKYGGNTPASSKIIKEKIKETCNKKYGGNAPLCSQEILKKAQNTNFKKYGTIVPAKSSQIKEKIINTNLKKYGFKDKKIYDFLNKIFDEWKDYIRPKFTKNEYNGLKNEYEWECVKCGNIFKQSIFTTHHLEDKFGQLIPRCLYCFPHISGFSNKEKELVEFCKQYFPNLNENNRSLIKPLELDIVIDDIKLALEFNGSFYHSIQNNFGVYIGYHLNKTVECNQKGYRLIHIWEDEWDNNKEIIKQMLIDIFTGNEIIDCSKPLDRSWYNNLKGEFEETPPEIIKRGKFEVENCGYLILK